MNLSIKSMPDFADSESWCPTCEKQVKCNYTSYIQLGYKHTISFIHGECGTEWTYDINSGEIRDVKNG